MFEQLESRLLLDGLSPEFATDLSAGYVIEPGGGGLTIGIDGYDADSDALTITVATDNPNLTYGTPYDAGQPAQLAVMHFVESDGVTPVGDIVIQLLEGTSGNSEDAVERFITLATNYVHPDGTLDPGGTPFYTDVVVHRIIDEFMIQTGDAANGNGTGDSPLDDLTDSFDPFLSFMGTGVAAFANAGANTSNSQFFITETPTTWLDQGYMIFGQVISGWDTLETLSQYPTDAGDRPLDPPLLDYVEIIESQQDATYTFIADDDFSGNAEVTVTIEDGDGNWVSQVITISVIAQPDVTVFPGDNGSFTPTFSDFTPQVECETVDPALADYVSVDPVTHEVTINVPADATATKFAVRLTAILTDFGNATEIETIFWVSVAGDEPEIENPGTLIIAPGETYSFFANITEDSPRGLDVAISSGNPDVQVAIDPATHEVQITAPTNFSGTYTVTISAVEQGFDNPTPGTETFYVFTSPAYDPQGVSQFIGSGEAITTAVVQLDDILYVTRGDMSAYTGQVDTYDVSDPANPVYLDSYATGDPAWDIEVINTTRNGADATIAFVANFFEGVAVLDVTDPSDITELTQFAVGDAGDSYLDVTLGVEIHNGYLYISNYQDGLEVYDISNLDDIGNITHVSRVKELTGSLDLYYVVDFVASGDFGYVVDAAGGTLVTLDISDPADITYATSYWTGSSPWDAEVQDGMLYVIDQVTGLNTFSLDTPASPAFMGKTGTATIPWTHFSVSGNIAAVATEDGFIFVDVSRPNRPIDAYEFTGPSYGQSPTFFGDYAALPLVDDGVFIVDVQGIINAMTFKGRRTFDLGNGKSVTVKVTGNGMARVTPTDGDPEDWELFEVFDSTKRSTVEITTVGGDITVGGIEIYDSLRRLTAKTTNLTGDFVAHGLMNTLRLDGVTDLQILINTTDMAVDGAGSLSIRVNAATDVSINTGGLPISSLTALDWTNTPVSNVEDIIAPRMNKLSITGLDAKNGNPGLPGDFEANLILTGQNNKGYSLNSAEIAGSITGGMWDIDGAIDLLKAQSTTADWQLDAGGLVKTLNARDSLAGTVLAERFRKIRTKGELTADITALGQNAKGVAIGSLWAGSVVDVTLTTLGGIKSIEVAEWLGGAIFADWIGLLQTNGETGVAGNFGADVTTIGQNDQGYSLENATITGSIVGGIWDVAGDVNLLRARSTTADWQFDAAGFVRTLNARDSLAGTVEAERFRKIRTKGELTTNITAVGQNARGVSIGILQAGIVGDVPLNVPGGIKSIEVAEWQGGSIAADWIGLLQTNGADGVDGDFGADVTTIGQNDQGYSLENARVAGGIIGGLWEVAGKVDLLRAGSTAAGWQLDVDGPVKTLNARDSLAGTISAERFKKINTKGDLTADITATGQNASGVSLTSLQVTGTALNSNIRTSSSIGSVTLGAVQGSDFLAGIDGGVDRHAVEQADFVNPQAVIKLVKIKGLPVPEGEVAPRFFENTNFSAARFGTVDLLKNIDYDNDDETFGFFALDQGTGKEIRLMKAKDTVSGETWKWPQVPEGDDIDFVVQII